MWRKGNLSAQLVGMQTGAATVENNMEFPQKIKNGTTFWPSDSASGDISWESQEKWKQLYMKNFKNVEK